MVWEHPGALAGPPIRWQDLHRVLVVRPDNLGDVVMCGPALRALRASAPRARLDLLASPAGAAVAALLPEVDDVLVDSVSWQQLAGSAPPESADRRLVDRIAAGRYDAAVILTSFSQSPWPAASLCRLAGVPIRVGMSREFGGAALTHWVPSVPDGTHQIDRTLHLLRRVGVAALDNRTHLRVPAHARSAARLLLAGVGMPAGEPYAVLLPGASCASRRYHPVRFAEVLARLRAAGLPVVVAGTAREASLVRGVAAGVPGVAVLAGELDVPTLAAVIADSRVVVCNNSGGAHLADALRIPSVVLFAGTDEVRQYRPRSAPSAVLTRSTPCAPCRQLTCPYEMQCLDVPAERVVAAALRVRLADVPGPRPRAVGAQGV